MAERKHEYDSDIIGDQIASAISLITSPIPVEQYYHLDFMKRERLMHDTFLGVFFAVMVGGATKSKIAAIVSGAIAATLAEFVIQPLIWEKAIKKMFPPELYETYGEGKDKD